MFCEGQLPFKIIGASTNRTESTIVIYASPGYRTFRYFDVYTGCYSDALGLEIIEEKNYELVADSVIPDSKCPGANGEVTLKVISDFTPYSPFIFYEVLPCDPSTQLCPQIVKV